MGTWRYCSYLDHNRIIFIVQCILYNDSSIFRIDIQNILACKLSIRLPDFKDMYSSFINDLTLLFNLNFF